MYRKVSFIVLVCGILFTSCNRPEFEVRVKETGVYNLVAGKSLLSGGCCSVAVVIPVEFINAQPGTVKIVARAEDIFGRPVKLEQSSFVLDVPAGKQKVPAEVQLQLSNGFYRIGLTAINNDKKADMGFTEIGVVPPTGKGLRPNSFFASNTSDIKLGKDLDLLDMVGIKVQRTHFYPDIDQVPEIPSDKPLCFDYGRLTAEFNETANRGIWVLPIAGYAFPGTRSVLAKNMNMHGPPRHFSEFALSWRDIVKTFPGIRVYELWNEPWIFEWTWAANAEDYRKLQKLWCDQVLDADPDLRIIAGNSCMFVEDNIEPFPEIWEGLIHGTSHHPYAHAEARSLRHNAQIRSIDYGFLVNNRMGLPYYYITEGGSLYSTPGHISAAAKDIESLSRQLIDRKHGKQLVNMVTRYRQLYAKASYPYTGGERAEESMENKGELKENMKVLASGNMKTRSILDKLFDALYVSLDDEPGREYNNNVNASKSVQYTVMGAIHGAYQNNIQWNLGYGPAWTRSNATLAVCHHFLEDRPVVTDIWPSTSLLYGGVFAHPKHIDQWVKDQPRSEELSARWSTDVPDDAKHPDTKVAVIFSLAGSSPGSLDSRGRLVIHDAEHIRAYDCTGRQIPAPGDSLVVPFNEYPVYLLTEELDVSGLHQAIAGATVRDLTVLNMYASSLTHQPEEDQVLHVRMDNLLAEDVEGEIRIYADGKIKGSTAFYAEPGLNELYVPLKDIAPDADQMYPFKIVASTGHGRYVREQLVQRALFSKGSRIIDGKLNDWEDSTPVLIDSEMMQRGADLTRYLFNPDLERPDFETLGDKYVAARVFTAYDDQFVYVAAEVFEDTLMNNAGSPAFINGFDTGYMLGMPGGLTHPRYTGDLLMLAFGFRDRVPGFGRQMNDPLSWKGHFYDTDYLYLAYTSTQGPQLIRQWGPETTRMNGFQTDPVETIGFIPGGKIAINRDKTRQVTVYEIAIPRQEINMFCEQQDALRFGFVLVNNEGAGSSGKLEWSEAAGVFDYWLNCGSYVPTWDQYLPCQTFFGIAGD